MILLKERLILVNLNNLFKREFSNVIPHIASTVNVTFRYKIDGGVLTILHTKVTDSGTYTCTRTDAGGETHRATAQLG